MTGRERESSGDGTRESATGRMRLSVRPPFVPTMFRTLIAETLEGEGGDRGLLMLVALVALGLVAAALRRRGGEKEEADAIDRIEVSSEDERGTADTSGSGIDRVSDEGTDYAQQSPPEGGEEDEAEEESEEETAGVPVDIASESARSRFADVDAVDWVMVLAAGVRAMREELQSRRAD